MPRTYNLIICAQRIVDGVSGRICFIRRKTLESEAQGIPLLTLANLTAQLSPDRYYNRGAASELPAGCYISLGYIEETCTIDTRDRDGCGTVSESYMVRSISFPPPPMPAAAPAAASTGEAEEED